MTDRSRRTILRGTAGLFALSAGCLDEADVSDDGNGDESEPSDDDPGAGGNGDENTESDDSDGNASSEGADDETVDSVPFSYSAGPESDPHAALLVDAGDASDWIDERGLEGDRLTEFVDEIDFETTVLVGVEADAPNPCHELALEDYELEGEETEANDGNETDDAEETDGDEETDAALELETAVVGDSEEGMGCTQVETVVGRLVRAPIADDHGVSITIVDRHGTEREISIAADSASESAADGGGESQNETDA